MKIICGLFLCLSFVTFGFGQNEKKLIKLAPSINSQLKFTEIKVGQKDQKFNESFDADAEWLKNISLKLKNISDKPIIYFKVNINFPETRSAGNLMSYGISFGYPPGVMITQDKLSVLLEPGENFEISLDKEKDKIFKFLNERQSSKSIQEIELEIGFIVFADKTAWAAGTFLRQDSKNPKLFKPVDITPK